MKIILITGAKRSGKDSFFKILNTLYEGFNKYAFADALKRDLEPICYGMFNNNFVDNLSDKEKEIFRPILIAYGCAWREIDKDHWVKVVANQIEHDSEHFDTKIFIPVISDCRFVNEIEYFKNKYGKENAIVVEIIRENGPDPTDEEKKNIPLIKPLVDHTITWPDARGQWSPLIPFVEEFYNKYLR